MLGSLADCDPVDAAMLAASPADRLAAVQLLAQIVQPSRSLLTATLPELAALEMDGRRKASALQLVRDHFPAWQSWPGRSLGDWLKTCRPGELAERRAVCADAGIGIDD